MSSYCNAFRSITVPRNFFALLVLMAATPGFAAALPAPAQGKNLPDCLNKLSRKIGGWCEIRASQEHPSISSVWPENLDKKIRMRTGLQSVLIAWNGAVFDAKRKIFYFFGGGHADYGGAYSGPS